MITLELTSRCRLACPKCARTNLKDLKIVDITLEQAEKIASTMKQRVIAFTGNYGDCIYHPQLFEIVKAFKRHGKNVQIDTNGSGKKDDWWETLYSLLDDKDLVVFAIDGFNETVGMYKKNFTQKDFDQALRMMQLGKKMGIKIIWNFIPFNFNEHQIPQVAEFCIENGIQLHIKKSRLWNRDDPLMPKNKKLISSKSMHLFTLP
ncbi:Radical_SAM domain containing protein [uncultured Caudovirales phage]|uniref:Radical_SAM domain containing protein n=1 Tax=uncultured Caudovirales phage TaxID=2100421 RepID=A0A6J7WZ72_9CAUD|nr:Radical_SAM domain containing protein [uncultured Caudovirales phage]